MVMTRQAGAEPAFRARYPIRAENDPSDQLRRVPPWSQTGKVTDRRLCLILFP
jgi:hypothetical protein